MNVCEVCVYECERGKELGIMTTQNVTKVETNLYFRLDMFPLKLLTYKQVQYRNMIISNSPEMREWSAVLNMNIYHQLNMVGQNKE